MGYVVEIKGLTKSYKKKKVVDNFSLNMKKGHIYGLIGPNGAGKTTIMSMMSGLTKEDSGVIRYFESDDLDSGRSRMSFTLEAPYMELGMTARENMEYIRILRGIADEKRIDEILEFVGLSDTAKKKAGEFSLGMRQRLGLGMMILPKPEVVVLDEPINGLDPEGIVDIRLMLEKLAKDDGMTILISSHILSELSELCTDFVFVNHGCLIEELSAEELSQKTDRYIRIKTDNIDNTVAVLENKLGIKDYKVNHDGELLLYERLDDIKTVSKTITDAGQIITRLNPESESLEDYYMRMVGERDE